MKRIIKLIFGGSMGLTMEGPYPGGGPFPVATFKSEDLPQTADGLVDWIEGSIKIEISDVRGRVFFAGYLKELREFAKEGE